MQESRRRVRHGRKEDSDQLVLVGHGAPEFAPGAARHEPQNPHAPVRVFDEADRVERGASLGQERLRDLLGPDIDGADDGGSVHQPLSGTDGPLPDPAPGEPADGDGEQQEEDDPHPVKVESDALRTKMLGDERKDDPVHPAREAPHQPQREADRHHHDHAGQEARTEAPSMPPLALVAEPAHCDGHPWSRLRSGRALHRALPRSGLSRIRGWTNLRRAWRSGDRSRRDRHRFQQPRNQHPGQNDRERREAE